MPRKVSLGQFLTRRSRSPIVRDGSDTTVYRIEEHKEKGGGTYYRIWTTFPGSGKLRALVTGKTPLQTEINLGHLLQDHVDAGRAPSEPTRPGQKR